MVEDPNERWLIDQLRKEASDVKSCFTNFSFQALAFSAAAFGVIIGFMDKGVNNIIVLAVIPVILFLMVVCRIGIFKYSSANRHNGYELHLARLNYLYKTSNSEDEKKAIENLKETRWEEAVKAWRVVQTRIFKTIYKTPDSIWTDSIPVLKWICNKLWPGLYSLTNKAKCIKDSFEKSSKTNCGYPWFMPKLLTSFVDGMKTRQSYHSGIYLENMMSILLLMQYLLLLPMGIIIYPVIINAEYSLEVPGLWIFIFLMIIIFLRHFRINRRREMLENELLSIHSCGIVWQAVILAHHIALKRMNGLEHYTEELTKIADEICTDIGNIHQWISNNMKTL